VTCVVQGSSLPVLAKPSLLFVKVVALDLTLQVLECLLVLAVLLDHLLYLLA